MNLEDLCMGCMSVKGSADICPTCHWQDGDEEESVLFLPPGTILNHKYLLGKVLGSGGFGVTYLALDLDLKIKLAIKEYLPNGFVTRNGTNQHVSVYSGNQESAYRDGLKKFLEEAMVLAKFSTMPGIVTVRDYFAENNTAYLVMYYLDGITFKEFLERNNEVIPYETGLTILLPALSALSEVHKHNILHRDISPDNIYITKDRQIKLLDFGAARQVLGEQSKSLDVILKRGYAPEEQYRTRGKQGPWTDVYAAGATFYRAIVGVTPPDSLERLAEDSLIAPSKLGITIPFSIERALLKALAVRSSDRYQTMQEFYEALITSSPGNEKSNPQSLPNEKTSTPPTPPASAGCLTLAMGLVGITFCATLIISVFF
ncbi:serine/threonine-protein kinase [Neobacillus sp. PS2-9]|uniref:serine/threonine protein kinase n=1 Tax=Neobacillus sp. PS2-9 TaxID=3070676 RepID=UPI0027E12C6F|nr:serine/threonine-protein kinase [Neobacillus sp. PS2-9]WML60561.1 serine/threonine-protein kinase [Neobacillus sp. PS2-9]